MSDRLRVIWFVFLCAAAYLLFSPPETVTALAIPPDSSEYAIGLINLLDHGFFGITLNGTWYPSRYTPWFSSFCLTPVHFLSGGNALCFNWAILAFAVALLWLMGLWGRKVGLGPWSLVAAALLLFVPDFVFYSRVVMTEIPYVTIFAASALAFLRLADKRRDVSVGLCLGAGALIAWGGAVRPSLLPMILPFAVVVAFFSERPWKWRLLRLIVLALPCVCYECANLGYNWAIFGSPSRTGYHYWMAVPYDFPSMTFNLAYVGQNVSELLCCPITQIACVMYGGNLLCAVLMLLGRLGGVRANKNYLLLTGFLLMQAFVLVALYVGYFWNDTRFYLAVTICSVPLFLGAIHRMTDTMAVVPRCLIRLSVPVLCGLAFLASPPRYYHMIFSRQVWLEKARIAAQVLPDHSVVIQDGDPNLLDHFCFRKKGFRIVPYARQFDYVVHMVAPKSIRNLTPPPANGKQMILPLLVTKGVCQLPFEQTFDEDPGQLRKYLAEGRRVFLEQYVLRGEANWESFQQMLKSAGLKSRYVGSWSSGETQPDTIRHVYDQLIFKRETLDFRPELGATFHEIVLDNEK